MPANLPVDFPLSQVVGHLDEACHRKLKTESKIMDVVGKQKKLNEKMVNLGEFSFQEESGP